MQPAVRPPRASLREWVARHPALAVGTFLSGIFTLLGLFGTFAFFPTMRIWADAADWPTTEAEITGSRINWGQRARGGRPEFTFNYTWQGRAYTAQGYDLIGAYFRGTTGGPSDVLKAHPVGSRVPVLVNPAQPGQAVLTRGGFGSVVVLFVPPFFLLLGLIGTFFTVISGLGWLNENTRNPLGRAIRAGWFLQEKVLKPFFFVVVGGVILGVAALGVSEGNFLLVGLAGFIVWGVWNAARPRKAQQRAGRKNAQ
jgi:hypothetical protein